MAATLAQRAAQATGLIHTLAERVGTLQTAVECSKIAVLKAENLALAQQVATAKAALIAAEIGNGKVQVQVPAKGAKIAALPAMQSSTSVHTPAAAAAAAPTAPALTEPAATATPPTKVAKKEKAPEAKGGAVADADATAAGEDVSVARLLLKVGLIVKAENHPDADSLFLETVECGEERPRTVISGLAGKVPLDQMQNRLVVLCANLKPVKMRGIVSEAMVMCASAEGKVEVLDPPAGAVPGDIVHVEGFLGVPDAQLNPKKKIFEAVQPDFLTDDNCVATYKGVPWSIKGKSGTIKAQTMTKSPIK